MSRRLRTSKLKLEIVSDTWQRGTNESRDFLVFRQVTHPDPLTLPWAATSFPPSSLCRVVDPKEPWDLNPIKSTTGTVNRRIGTRSTRNQKNRHFIPKTLQKECRGSPTLLPRVPCHRCQGWPVMRGVHTTMTRMMCEPNLRWRRQMIYTLNSLWEFEKQSGAKGVDIHHHGCPVSTVPLSGDGNRSDPVPCRTWIEWMNKD